MRSSAWRQVGPEVVDVLDPDRHPHQPVGHRRGLGLPATTALEGGLDAAEGGRMDPQRGGVGEEVGLLRGGQDHREHAAEPGVADLSTAGCAARRSARVAALAEERSTRRCRVRRPRSASHASNGPGIAPSRSRRPLSTAHSASSAVTTAPMRTSLWPARYLVAEWTTMSAPSASGCWSRGVAKVLSTTTYAPASWAAAMIVAMSASSSAGLVGRLEPDQRGVLAGRDARRGVGDVDQRGRQPAARLEVGQLARSAVVGVPRHDHRASRDQVEHRGDRREPGGERQRATALERPSASSNASQVGLP